MAKKTPTKVTDIVADEPTQEEQLAAIAEASTPPGIKGEPPILAMPAATDTIAEEEIEEDEEEEEAPKRIPIKDRLGDVDEEDLEELLKITSVAERLQKSAEERANAIEKAERDRIAREDQDRKDREDQEYLRRLRKTDPIAYNEELDKREAQDEDRRAEVKRIKSVTDVFTKRLNEFVQTKVDPTVANKFKGKDYTNLDLVDGVIQYIDDLMTEERTVMRRVIEKEIEPVLRKKILTELNGTEETPQPANETRVIRKSTKTKIDFQNESEAAEAFAKGLQGLPGGITKAEMIAWYKGHGKPR